MHSIEPFQSLCTSDHITQSSLSEFDNIQLMLLYVYIMQMMNKQFQCIQLITKRNWSKNVRFLEVIFYQKTCTKNPRHNDNSPKSAAIPISYIIHVNDVFGCLRLRKQYDIYTYSCLLCLPGKFVYPFKITQAIWLPLIVMFTITLNVFAKSGGRDHIKDFEH